MQDFPIELNKSKFNPGNYKAEKPKEESKQEEKPWLV